MNPNGELRGRWVLAVTFSSAPIDNIPPDEVSALVIDIGSSTLRAGYAGDETPKAIIPTSYGFHRDHSNVDVSMGDAEGDVEGKLNQQHSKNVRLYLGQHGPSIWREDMEVENPMSEGLGAFEQSPYHFFLP